MDPNQRIDYFRSELEGKLEELRKAQIIDHNRLVERIAKLKKQMDDYARAWHRERLAR